MRFILSLIILGTATEAAEAQQRDTSRRAPRDSAAIADSIARADSILLVRELERIAGERRTLPPEGAGAQRAASRLLPDISLLGDLSADFSPDGSTQEDGSRFGIRELELGIQAAVDPYFRADAFLGISDLEGVSIEEAYLSTLALPHGLQIRAGRWHLPVGKQNTTHRPELHTIEYPHVIQRFLGPEGGKGTGLWVSKLFAPFGFYQELQVVAMDRFGGAAHGHGEEEEAHDEDLAIEPDEPVNESLSGLGYGARLRNYWDLSQATNIELSASAVTGKATQGVFCVPTAGGGEIPCAGMPTGVNVRTGIVGADFTFRWRPLQQGLYRSFIFQTEWMRQLNDDTPELFDAPAGFDLEYEGPTRSFDGIYAFARYQLSRRTYVGARYDWLEDPDLDGSRVTAASGYLTFFPSEFSKLVAGYERVMPSGGLEATNRFLVQATFALGPHRPHPF